MTDVRTLDPALLIGRKPRSLYEMTMSAMEGDHLDIAETMAATDLVEGRAHELFGPTPLAEAATELLSPVAALAGTVAQIDRALGTVHRWLSQHTIETLRMQAEAMDAHQDFRATIESALDDGTIDEEQAEIRRRDYDALYDVVALRLQIGLSDVTMLPMSESVCVMIERDGLHKPYTVGCMGLDDSIRLSGTQEI